MTVLVQELDTQFEFNTGCKELLRAAVVVWEVDVCLRSPSGKGPERTDELRRATEEITRFFIVSRVFFKRRKENMSSTMILYRPQH